MSIWYATLALPDIFPCIIPYRATLKTDGNRILSEDKNRIWLQDRLLSAKKEWVGRGLL
jgi:hypothetical protein